MISLGATTRTILLLTGGFAISATAGCSLQSSDRLRSERAQGSATTASSTETVRASDPSFVFVEGEEADNSCEMSELRAELLAMEKEDQKWRLRLIRANKDDKDDLEKLRAVDARNLTRMREIVDTYGWPMKSMVGVRGAFAAHLLVQHADRDVAFQRRCLTLMRTLVEIDEVSRKNVAYLTDRVLCAEGKPQIYGTQFHLVDGKQEPRPIQDAKNVDKRRLEIGLPTLDEYREIVRT